MAFILYAFLFLFKSTFDFVQRTFFCDHSNLYSFTTFIFDSIYFVQNNSQTVMVVVVVNAITTWNENRSERNKIKIANRLGEKKHLNNSQPNCICRLNWFQFVVQSNQENCLFFFAQMHVPVKTRFYSFAVNYWYHYFSSRKPATLFFLLLPRRSVKFADFIILVHQNMWFQVKSNLIQDICLTLTENKCNVQKAIFYSRKHNVENEREKKCIQNAPMKMWRFFFLIFCM